MHKWASRPFRSSLEALARLALQETGASGFAYFEHNSTGAKTSLAGHGTIDTFAGADASSRLVDYPLQNDGVPPGSITFVFAEQEAAVAARPALDRIAKSIELLWNAGPLDVYQNLLGRLAVLEMELIDSKIADRAQGILSAPARSDSAEAIARHVEGVLRPSHARLTLEQILVELEEEMGERRLVAEAKRVLQAERGLTEEQAHAELRVASRKSRRKLKEVASQIIGDHRLPEGKIA